MRRLIRKALRALVDYDPAYYDMGADANELCFAELYLHHIRQRAQQAGIRPPAAVLDAGCQAGRLVVPLAQEGFRLTGIDASRFGLRRAQQHLRKHHLTAELIRGDILAVLDGMPQQQFDLVLCLEVLYLCRNYRPMLGALARATRSGGLLCASHRNPFYYQQRALRAGELETAERVGRTHEGGALGGAYYNWQTAEELQALYEGLGLTDIALYPIDRRSWREDFNPGDMDEPARRAWLESELKPATPAEAVQGRYTLVIARKP